MSLVASRLHCYNPLSQNSEHGLPTEKRDREVDWFEVRVTDRTSLDHLTQENSREEEEGLRGGGWNGGIEKWHLWSGDLTWGNTINHWEERGLLHDSGPVLLRVSRVDGKSVTVGKSQRRRRNMGLIVSSTLQAEPCVSPTCVTVPSGWLHSEIWLWVSWGQGTFGSDLPPGAFHVSQEDPDKRSKVLNWQFVLVPSSHLLHLACPKLTYEWSRLYPGSGWASCMQVQFWGLSSSVISELNRSSVLPGEVREADTGGWGLLPEETLCQDGSI